jgi:orotate phosphoribosyltransferase-like protein
MNDTQRKEIQRLRQAGMGYGKIAQSLSISANTVKAYCRRNGLAGTRAIEESADPFAPITQTKNNASRTGRVNLISSENRVNSSVAEGAETIGFTGFSASQTTPQVDLVFAEETDVKAVHEVLGMLLRENHCDE